MADGADNARLQKDNKINLFNFLSPRVKDEDEVKREREKVSSCHH